MFFQKKESNDDYYQHSINNLEMRIMQLKEQLSELQKYSDTLKTDMQTYRSDMLKIAQVLCDQTYSMDQLGHQKRMSNSSFELSSFIIENVKKQRGEMLSLIMELQQANKKHEAKQKELETHLSRLRSEGSTLDEQTSWDATNQTIIVSMNELYQRLTPLQKKMIQLIGNTGISNEQDIIDALLAQHQEAYEQQKKSREIRERLEHASANVPSPAQISFLRKLLMDNGIPMQGDSFVWGNKTIATIYQMSKQDVAAMIQTLKPN